MARKKTAAVTVKPAGAVVLASETEVIPAPVQDRTTNLLALAVQNNASIDVLERLMALQQKADAEKARMAFAEAMCNFQSECPPIPKTRSVDYASKGGGKTSYKFAPLDVIANTIQLPLAKNGLSYRWEIDDKQADTIIVTCVVTHTFGHSERTTMQACLDDTGSKNIIQQRGSSVAYLQRYTVIGALGLTTANEDDDGRSAGKVSVEELMEHVELVRDRWQDIAAIKYGLADRHDLNTAVESWLSFTDEEKRILWRAPTKGGIFTTEERKLLHDDPEVARIVRESLQYNADRAAAGGT